MRLIRRVTLSEFRSLEDENLEGLGDLTAIVGKNSSGKSNVLRALNLFFNGEIEKGKGIVFARDHFERIPRSKKKKRISISVEFDLPPTFHLRKEVSTITHKSEI